MWRGNRLSFSYLMAHSDMHYDWCCFRVNKETYGEKTGRRFGLGLDANPAII